SDALPVIDDDRARARKGHLVNLAPRVEHIRVGDGDDHLAGLEPLAVQYRLLRIGRAADNMRAAHDLARLIDRNDLNAFPRHPLNERLPMRRIGAEDLHALAWAHRADRRAARP